MNVSLLMPSSRDGLGRHCVRSRVYHRYQWHTNIIQCSIPMYKCYRRLVAKSADSRESHMIQYGVLNISFIIFTNKHSVSGGGGGGVQSPLCSQGVAKGPNLFFMRIVKLTRQVKGCCSSN